MGNTLKDFGKATVNRHTMLVRAIDDNLNSNQNKQWLSSPPTWVNYAYLTHNHGARVELSPLPHPCVPKNTPQWSPTLRNDHLHSHWMTCHPSCLYTSQYESHIKLFRNGWAFTNLCTQWGITTSHKHIYVHHTGVEVIPKVDVHLRTLQ